MAYKIRTRCIRGHNVESDNAVYRYVSKQGHKIRECKLCTTAKNTRRATQLRANHLMRIFGRTLEQYATQLELQGNCCAVCGATEPGGNGNKSFHYDHDRNCCPGKKSCGKCVRDLLCSDCNTALGLMKDDLRVLRAMIAYLEKHGNLDNQDNRHDGMGEAAQLES